MPTRAQSAAPATCSICAKTAGSRLDFPHQTPTSACEHPVQTCNDCLRQWFHTCLDTHYQPRVPCPNCDMVLIGHAELSRASTKEDHARYRYIHGRISRGSNPQWKFCLNPACGSLGQRHPPSKGDDSQPVSEVCICKACETQSCARCNKPWHDSITCEDFQQSRAAHAREDELSEELKRKLAGEGTIKACPNCECGIEITSPTGKFTCARCLHAIVESDGKNTVPDVGKRVVQSLDGGEDRRVRKVTFLLPGKSMDKAPG
jgi:protein-arginine kinase activator protein McsA